MTWAICIYLKVRSVHNFPALWRCIVCLFALWTSLCKTKISALNVCLLQCETLWAQYTVCSVEDIVSWLLSVIVLDFLWSFQTLGPGEPYFVSIFSMLHEVHHSYPVMLKWLHFCLVFVYSFMLKILPTDYLFCLYFLKNQIL